MFCILLRTRLQVLLEFRNTFTKNGSNYFKIYGLRDELHRSESMGKLQLNDIKIQQHLAQE